MTQKYPDHMVRKIVEDDTNHEYSLLSIESKGKKNPNTGKYMKRKMLLKHNECGHEYEINIYEFTEGKRRCGKCKGKVLREHFSESIESIVEQTQASTNGEYSFVDDKYINAGTAHSFKHNTCGTTFKKKWSKFQIGQRCPNCNKKGMESAASIHTRDILDTFNVNYELEKRFDTCINPQTGMTLPFDYYLPDINTLIEIDGEQHERDSFSKYASSGVIERDQIKNRFAEDNCITLIRIPAKKWSQLPEILHTILSKVLLKSLTLEEVKAVNKSERPKRINKDLEKIHHGEYALHDNFYFGVDRYHNYIHHTCGKVFRKTLSNLKAEKIPCTHCKKKAREKRQHDAVSKKLFEKTKGRYSLNDKHIGLDAKKRRFIHCHTCEHKWYALTSNILSDNGGCPECYEIAKSKKKSA